MPVARLLAPFPVVLAPMEDVSDAPFRRLCRALGAGLCVTEFVRAEQLIADAAIARRKIALGADDRPTAIQIYGANADLLLEAAELAAAARPAFVDINCGCWVPRVAGKGAGAAWLRDPDAMVAMAGRIAKAVDLPVTVKTRIGWGPESHMPIVELARRLEDAGVAALTIHCRTAQMGHAGAADWAWARRAREAVKIPVVVNGDVKSAADVVRALGETGCAGVMIGRAAIDYPWIFREARALLAGGGGAAVAPAALATPAALAPPSDAERVATYAALVAANVAARGEKWGIQVTRRHLGLLGPTLQETWKKAICAAKSAAETEDVLARVQEQVARGDERVAAAG